MRYGTKMYAKRYPESMEAAFVNIDSSQVFLKTSNYNFDWQLL